MKFRKSKQQLPPGFKPKSPLSLQLLIEATRNYFNPNLVDLSPSEILSLSRENLEPPLKMGGYSLEAVDTEVRHMYWRHIDVAATFSRSRVTLCHASDPETIIYKTDSLDDMMLYLRGVNCGVDSDGRELYGEKMLLVGSHIRYSFEYQTGMYKGRPNVHTCGPFLNDEAEIWKSGYDKGKEMYYRRKTYLARNKKSTN